MDKNTPRGRGAGDGPYYAFFLAIICTLATSFRTCPFWVFLGDDFSVVVSEIICQYRVGRPVPISRTAKQPDNLLSLPLCSPL